MLSVLVIRATKWGSTLKKPDYLFSVRKMGTSILLFVSSESGNASWEIAQVTLKDEGYYECIAISSAGTGRARTFLDVSGKHM